MKTFKLTEEQKNGIIGHFAETKIGELKFRDIIILLDTLRSLPEIKEEEPCQQNLKDVSGK